MSEPEKWHTIWEHLNKRCSTGCPYCHIAELKAELAALKALLRDAVHRIGDDGFDGIWKKEALAALQEKGE